MSAAALLATGPWRASSGRSSWSIPGTTSVADLEENLGAGGLELDDQDMAVLDDVKQDVRAAH